MKKSLLVIGIILLTILLAVVSVMTAIRIRNLGTRPVAPSAPESKPKAAEELPESPVASCKTTFFISSPSVTPTPTPGPTSTPGPSPTPTPEATGTPGPSPTSTPVPSPQPTYIAQQPVATPTEIALPVAGLHIPTLTGILAGFLLISLGVALVF